MSAQLLPSWYRASATTHGTVHLTDQGSLHVTVTLQTLVELLDPLHADPWNVGGVRPQHVHAALRENRLRPRNPCWDETPQAPADAQAHAERIAWLIRHGWDTTTPVHLEVDHYGGVCLNDGNHRLYALTMLCVSDPVLVELSGYLDIAEELLGIQIPHESASSQIR